MARLNLRQSVIELLSAHPETRFTARKIALYILEHQREACDGKRANSTQDLSTDAALVQQLVAEIAANRPAIIQRCPKIRTTETRPRSYYYSNLTEEAEVSQAENINTFPAPTETTLPATNPREADLYPLLCSYLYTELGLYPKRIDERRSSNRRGPNGNKWLYPDLVALEDVGADWEQEIRACVKETKAQRARLWSFEVKLLLNRSNVREAWFQAVSNSSWANFGYLVAAEVEGKETMQELRILAAAHGIGLMVLDKDDPSESEIRIPARERINIDWDTCNRLAQENKDFLDFMTWIRHFHQTDDPDVRKWDVPLS